MFVKLRRKLFGQNEQDDNVKVGAISKAQKAQNIFLRKFFLSENVAQCRKM